VGHGAYLLDGTAIGGNSQARRLANIRLNALKHNFDNLQ
jgi:hypothetical protein